MDDQLKTTCRFCKATVSPDAYFCSNCGKKLREKPPATTLWRQIVVYFVSLFIPPFGLWYAYKYFKAGDYKSKIIAIVAIILTVVSLAVSIWLTSDLVNSVNQSLDQINSLNI